MAGEWLKVELSTPDKPEVLRMSRILGIDKDSVFGKLIRVWGWFDRNSVDGHVDGVVDADIDDIAFQDGFLSAMKLVGWADFDNDGQWVCLNNFDRHNGETAKQRALKNERQSKWRNKTSTQTSTDASTQTSTDASTREEKRREDIYIPPISPSLLSDFLKVRKAKKAGDLTETAFLGIEREAKKAGLTAEQAIQICCERGWQGFKAEWVSQQPANPYKSGNGVVI